MVESLDSQLAACYHASIPEDHKFMLDQPLDSDNDGVETDLGKIADSMDEWEGRVAEELGLTSVEIAAIREECPGPAKLKKRTRAVLQKWKEKWGPNATCRNLITVFVKANKKDCAKAVCGVLTNLRYVEVAENLPESPPPTKRPKQIPPVSHYADYLKGIYEHKSVLDEKSPKIPCEKFIRLALVKKIRINQLEADKFTRATLHGEIDKILKQKEPITINDLFKPNHSNQSIKCVFVYGAPGIGKSTFAVQLCRSWDRIETLRHYALIVLLRLREKRVQEIRTVAELFHHYDDPSLPQAVAKHVVENEGRNVLLVFDGFDELPSEKRKKSFLVDVICGRRIPHCTVLVTTRPSVCSDLKIIAQPQKEIEILGFTEERIQEFAISKFEKQTDIQEDFLKYTKSNPPIRSFMYIPLNGVIVTEIYRETRTTGRPIPQTMTQLYSELCHVLLVRYLEDKGDPLDDLPEKLQDLPSNLYHPILALAKLAFVGIQKEEFIFSKLPKECHESHFGFMNKATEPYMGRIVRVSYNFLHLTLQEFLAAFYISQLSDSFEQVLEMIITEKRWNIVGRFVAGLTGIGSSVWQKLFSRYKLKLEETRPNTVPYYILQCFYESQPYQIDCQRIFGVQKMQFEDNVHPTILDFYALGQCVTFSNCPWIITIDISKTGLGNESLTMLASGLKSSSIVHGSIEQLSVTSNYNHKLLECAFLSDFPLNILQNLSILHLRNGILDYSALADVVPAMSQLTVLDISYTSPIDDSGRLEKLFTELSKLEKLIELDVHRINLGIRDIQALASVTTQQSSVKRLSIGDDCMSSECVNKMLQLVLSPSSLQSLKVLYITIDNSDAMHFQFRNIASNLHTLILTECLGMDSIKAELEYACKTNQLTVRSGNNAWEEHITF